MPKEPRNPVTIASVTGVGELLLSVGVRLPNRGWRLFLGPPRNPHNGQLHFPEPFLIAPGESCKLAGSTPCRGLLGPAAPPRATRGWGLMSILEELLLDPAAWLAPAPSRALTQQVCFQRPFLPGPRRPSALLVRPGQPPGFLQPGLLLAPLGLSIYFILPHK